MKRRQPHLGPRPGGWLLVLLASLACISNTRGASADSITGAQATDSVTPRIAGGPTGVAAASSSNVSGAIASAGVGAAEPPAPMKPGGAITPEAEHEAAQRLSEAQVLALEGKWEQARLVFLQAYAVHPTSVVLWDLAVAEIKSDHALEAAQHLQQYRRHPNAEPAKLSRLKDYLGRVYARIGRLQIDAPASTMLMVDGVRTDWNADDPVVLAPGEHSVVLSYGDHRMEKKVKLSPSAVAPLSFRPPTPPPVPSTNASDATSGIGAGSRALEVDTSVSSSPSLRPRTIALIAGGSLTIASAVVGSVFALKGWRATTDADDQGKALGPASCTVTSPACADLARANEDAHSAHRVAGISFIAAGAFGAATVGMLLFWKNPRSSSIGFGASPSTAWVTGSF